MPERDESAETRRRAEASEILRELLSRERIRFVRLAASCVKGDPVDPEDVVQAACISFLTSFKPRGENDNSAAYFGAAVKTSASKLRRTLQRKQRLDLPLEDRPQALEAGEVSRLEGELDRLRVELAALPERERRAVGLRLLGFTPDECAGAIGATPRAYRKAIGRANERLRDSLGE